MIPAGAPANFRLPFLFIATGMAGFALFHGVSIVQWFGWAAAHPRGPVGWTLIHLAVLGWGTMVAMGAVYQLINVVLQSDTYSRSLGYVHYGCMTIGTAGLLHGFYYGDVRFIGGFATLTFVGILLFALNIGGALLRAKQWNPVTIAAAAALGYLVLTGLTGMGMGLNFAFGWLGGSHDGLLGAHIWFGAAGWFGQLIIGFSYKMLPMFYLAHGHPTRLEMRVILLWNAAVWTGALGFLLGAPVWIELLALTVLLAALAMYNLYTRQVKKHKWKQSPGEGVVFSLWALRGFTCFLAAALIYWAWNPQELLTARGISVLGWAYLWGWVAFTILGYLSKIAPFLWWTHKYGRQVGSTATPALSDLISERHVRFLLLGMGGLTILFLAGLASSSAPLLRTAGTALSAAALAYAVLIGRVFLK